MKIRKKDINDMYNDFCEFADFCKIIAKMALINSIHDKQKKVKVSVPVGGIGDLRTEEKEYEVLESLGRVPEIIRNNRYTVNFGGLVDVNDWEVWSIHDSNGILSVCFDDNGICHIVDFCNLIDTSLEKT